MKALILAAGFGTRLEPYTNTIPKPLFTLGSKPVLAHAIDALCAAGCTEILINTHHLHDQISAFTNTYPTPAKITLLHEPMILDTGGAIANARKFLTESPFFVMNADIFSSIDLSAAFMHHTKSAKLATLVLHDCPLFNKVDIGPDSSILGFNAKTEHPLAFTGIQILSPEIFNYLPDQPIFSSIDLYKSLCPQKQVGAYVVADHFWSDIGTPDSYRQTSLEILCAKYFGLAPQNIGKLTVTPLKGDGSDRHWSRVHYKDSSVIACSHDICLPDTDQDRECRAFVKIGYHLNDKKMNVPKILGYDRLSGTVIVEDKGDTHLQTVVRNRSKSVISFYRQVIDNLILFSTQGVDGFNPEWTCQTTSYSRELILEKECRYFIDAFVNGYLGMDQSFDVFRTEFETIADQALTYKVPGLLHRDMQSRNIMIHQGTPYFIDYQAARIGPITYDLASLLIDPYVAMDSTNKTQLLSYAMDRLDLKGMTRQQFEDAFTACCITRNLQALGAYGFLTRVKKKKSFELYIPAAVNSLRKIIAKYDQHKALKLSQLVSNIKGEI